MAGFVAVGQIRRIIPAHSAVSSGEAAMMGRVESSGARADQSARDERHGVDRLEAFSDGVFAIAITLLVLGIEIPNVNEDDLGTALTDLGPSVFGYFLGFAVIGLFWVGHHAFFVQVARHDGRLLWSNLLFLSLIAAMPFSSGLLGDYGDSELAVIVFAANVSLAALASYLTEQGAIRSGLMRPGSELARRPLLTAELLVPAVFALSIPIALVSVTGAQLFWLLAIFAGRVGDGTRRAPGSHD